MYVMSGCRSVVYRGYVWTCGVPTCMCTQSCLTCKVYDAGSKICVCMSVCLLLLLLIHGKFPKSVSYFLWKKDFHRLPQAS